MRLANTEKLTEADYKVMQDYIDELARKCKVERFLVWDHPQPAEGPFDGKWMTFAEE